MGCFAATGLFSQVFQDSFTHLWCLYVMLALVPLEKKTSSPPHFASCPLIILLNSLFYGLSHPLNGSSTHRPCSNTITLPSRFSSNTSGMPMRIQISRLPCLCLYPVSQPYSQINQTPPEHRLSSQISQKEFFIISAQ